MRDANGNLSTRSLLATSGHDGEDALVLKEFHADGGVFENRYDVFGDRRTTVNEVGKTEAYAYDALDRLVEQDHQARAAGSVGNATGSAVQLKDYYAYDGLGQRTQHWNSQLGSGVKETTDYDAQGRVVSMVDMGGNTTTYGYAWSGSIATSGLGTFGGWNRTTVNAAGKTATEQLDFFGRTVDKVDFGAHDFGYAFDYAGRLKTMTLGTSTVAYGYYNSGLTSSIVSDAVSSITYAGTTYTTDARATSSYKYDALGERTFEGYQTASYTNGTLSASHAYQSASVTWGADGRMASFTDTGDSGTDNAAISWEYDLAGNIRHMAATYHALDEQGNVTSATNAQDYWYRYDSMNRFVVTKGMLSGTDAQGNYASGTAARGFGTIQAGFLGGFAITYDAAGERVTRDSTAIFGGTTREVYAYTADGYLATVRIGADTASAVLRANYVRDAMGRVTSYAEYAADGTTVEYTRADTFDAKSQVTQEVVSQREQDNDVDYYTTTNDYKLEGSTAGVYNGAYMGGVITHSATEAHQIESGGGYDDKPDTDTKNGYAWWDSAVQASIAYKPDISKSTVNSSAYAYDALGRLTSVQITDGRPRTVSFVTNADGTIIQRDEADASSSGDPREIYYYFQGMRVGDVSNNGTSDTDYAASLAEHLAVPGTGAFRDGASYATSYADFDQSYDPINGLNYDATATRYTVVDGDTLSSIAQTVWGDASLWYLIADANGLDGSETLVGGRDLVIPNKVANIHNNADTYRVYDPNDSIGNTAARDGHFRLAVLRRPM